MAHERYWACTTLWGRKLDLFSSCLGIKHEFQIAAKNILMPDAICCNILTLLICRNCSGLCMTQRHIYNGLEIIKNENINKEKQILVLVSVIAWTYFIDMNNLVQVQLGRQNSAIDVALPKRVIWGTQICTKK